MQGNRRRMRRIMERMIELWRRLLDRMIEAWEQQGDEELHVQSLALSGTSDYHDTSGAKGVRTLG